MQKLLDTFKIDETYTKPTHKPKVFNKVKENVYPEPHYNYMADLLELPKTVRLQPFIKKADANSASHSWPTVEEFPKNTPPGGLLELQRSQEMW